MWIFVERYGAPSARSRVTAAALSSHARCRQLVRELRQRASRSGRPPDPEIRSALSRLDTEAGRLEAYWYLLLRGSSVERWRTASARCQRLRRLVASPDDLPGRGAARVAMDADRSGHPKRARAARRAARAMEETPGGQRIDKLIPKIATLLRRDADAWRSLTDRLPGPDDAAIEASLLRGLLRQRKRLAASVGVAPLETPAGPAFRRKRQKRAHERQKPVHRLIWQLELIGASGNDGLGPLLSELRTFAERLSERQAVAAFAAQLDRLPLPEADQRRLEKAVGDTWARLHDDSRPRTGWRKDRLAAALARDLQRWLWRGYLED